MFVLYSGQSGVSDVCMYFTGILYRMIIFTAPVFWLTKVHVTLSVYCICERMCVSGAGAVARVRSRGYITIQRNCHHRRHHGVAATD